MLLLRSKSLFNYLALASLFTCFSANSEDLDFNAAVEDCYKGSASEYGLFNILNNVDDKLYIDGIPVDINPITEGKSGTIAQFLARNHILDQMESFKRVTGIALQF